MSRIIAGHIEDKRWILFQGLRNCGKGMISDMLKNSFESYIRTTNSGNFIIKKASAQVVMISQILNHQIQMNLKKNFN